MKVKVFSSDNIKKVEKEISEWLESEKPEICFVGQSESTEKDEWNITITIWYK